MKRTPTNELTQVLAAVFGGLPSLLAGARGGLGTVAALAALPFMLLAGIGYVIVLAAREAVGPRTERDRETLAAWGEFLADLPLWPLAGLDLLLAAAAAALAPTLDRLAAGANALLDLAAPRPMLALAVALPAGDLPREDGVPVARTVALLPYYPDAPTAESRLEEVVAAALGHVPTAGELAAEQHRQRVAVLAGRGCTAEEAELLARAFALRDERLSWREVARRLGVAESTLRGKVKRVLPSEG